MSSARVRSRTGRLLVALLLALAAGCTGNHGSARQPVTSGAGRVVVLPSPDSSRWVRLLRASGVDASAWPSATVPAAATLVVAPTSARLSSGTERALASWTRAGGTLVTARPDLLSRIGVSVRGPVAATGLLPDPTTPSAIWAHPVRIRPLALAGSRTLDRTTAGATVVLDAEIGHGRLLALGIDPVADGRTGYELLPQIGRDVFALPGSVALPRRVGADVYLDPGTLPPDQRTPAAIARRLDGVRSVKIAAWDLFDDSSADVPYRAIVDALHARGVLAYAWLEPPFVSLRLWTHHPECRERNRAGKDAHGDWRLLIALEDPGCLALAVGEWRAQLATADWDGVDVAELYFEPGPGSTETPYSTAALRAFGRDPSAAPAAFAAFRTSLATRINAQVLAQLAGLPGARSRETVLTVIDDTLDPALAARAGQDLAALMSVAKRAGATLEVEDPFSQWSDGPLRYDRVTARLARQVEAGAWLVDVNVVDRQGARPTTRMTGAELDLAVQAAGAGGRAALYSAASVTAADLAHTALALGSYATTTPDGGLRAPWTVVVTAPDPTRATRLSVDGTPWPCSKGRAVVPSGAHSLRWDSGPAAGPGLVSLPAELGTASTSPHTVRFTYFSRSQTYAVVDHRPNALRIDGGLVPIASRADPDGGWTVTLPIGRHDVVLTTDF